MRGGLDCASLYDRDSVVWIDEHDDASQLRQNLVEQIEPFPGDLGGQPRQACDVPAWTRQAGDKPFGDGIPEASHDDRDCSSDLSNRLKRWRCVNNNHIDGKAN